VTPSDRRRLFGTLIGLAICLWTLWPTFQFYVMSPAERREVLQARPAAATNDADRARLQKMANLRDRAIKLGLDLQGGMYLLLEVDKSKLGPAEAKNAVDQAMQIIRNRIDQFGVAEPTIQKQGDNRILVQLPGLLDQGRAKELIGQTALLEFKIVKTDDEAHALFNRIDGYFARKMGGAAADTTGPDSLRHPFTGRFLTVAQGSESFALSSEVAAIDSMLTVLRSDSTFTMDAALELRRLTGLPLVTTFHSIEMDRCAGFYPQAWIEKIEGSYTGIMGLPLHETAALLEWAGVAVRP